MKINFPDRGPLSKIKCDGCGKRVDRDDAVTVLSPTSFGGNKYCSYLCPGLPK